MTAPTVVTRFLGNGSVLENGSMGSIYGLGNKVQHSFSLKWLDVA